MTLTYVPSLLCISLATWKFTEWADDDRAVAGSARRSFALAAA